MQEREGVGAQECPAKRPQRREGAGAGEKQATSQCPVQEVAHPKVQRAVGTKVAQEKEERAWCRVRGSSWLQTQVEGPSLCARRGFAKKLVSQACRHPREGVLAPVRGWSQ